MDVAGDDFAKLSVFHGMVLTKQVRAIDFVELGRIGGWRSGMDMCVLP